MRVNIEQDLIWFAFGLAFGLVCGAIAGAAAVLSIIKKIKDL